MDDAGLWLKSSWREPVGAEFLGDHFARSLVEILTTTMADMSTLVNSVLQLGEVDQSVIWGWNRDVPETTRLGIHELIAEMVRERPDAEAICSWDGNFSYADVDRLSTILAHHLISLGVKVGDIVPLCFEKSRWTTIAVMAVIKAGAAFVLMDPSQPLQRRQVMADQVSARLILTSPDQAANGAQIVPQGPTLVVDQKKLSLLADSSEAGSNELPCVPPDSLLYIIFTSGSTGTPKGVMISHTTYSTSALARSTGIGYSRVSRSLDFTSYAFDVSVDSILCTLLRGGCLCIPDDADRVNDLSGAIRRFKVNMVNVTPSVARILDPDIIPSLNSLGIGGESCSAGDITAWGRHTRVVVGYGPAECTIGCTVNPSAAGKPYVSIGSGTGAVIWLVDPENHDKLVPFGAVGELLIEGPIVGQGYLGDPEKTAASFINDPKFLLEGGGGVPGRRGRLYKTGDLLRYDPDGEAGFVFVGRKDTQIKLRGQRVELGEIEHHIKNLLPSGAEVVAEIVAPRNQEKESMLVAFIADRDTAAKDNGDPRQIDLPPHFHQEVEHLSEKLSKVLPIYMVPVWYIELSKIPMLVSGKTDRKSLRVLGAEISASLQASASAEQSAEPVREPQSATEIFLRGIWSGLLGLQKNQISTTHNFFMLGGDSVIAMKLVPAAREGGFALTVADVFNNPVLSSMAAVMQREDSRSQADLNIPTFSLLDSDVDRTALVSEAAEQCGCEEALVEDIYPCAPMQEIHMAFYTRSKENFIAQRIADIPESLSISKLKSAWGQVFRESAIMRTRIVEFKQHGFMQVIINQDMPWKEVNSSLPDFMAQDSKDPMSPGAPLSRFAVVNNDATGQRHLVWTAHHAIYDGWSDDLILEHAKAAYKGQVVSRPAEFKHFIRFLTEPSRAAASKDYWRAQLQGATGPQFPSLPSRSFIPDPTSLAEKFIALKQTSRSEITIATVIRAAWALVASQYTMSSDVVLGETFMGRTIPVPGAELIEGPILATVPVRIHVDRTATVQEYLRSVQDQGTVRAAHDHLGIQHIRRLSPDAQIACEVTVGLVVQPVDPDDVKSSPEDFPLFRGQDAALEALHFNSYPLMLACSLQKGGFRLLASYDSAILSDSQVKRVLAQFECAISQIRDDQTRSLGEITCMSDEELGDIWEKNRTQPLPPSNMSKALSSGDRYPIIQYVPWIVHPANPDLLMPIGAVGELILEGAIVRDATDKEVVPRWLKSGFEGIPGRHGKLYHTGDLVRYADDMSLLFIGRKETMSNIDGHVVNLKTTDSELSRLLPAGTEVSSRLILPKGSANQTPMVVAFVQETQRESSAIDLDVNHEEGNVPLASTISLELARGITGLHKALAEVLPPYAIPSICIPIATATDSGKPIELDNLDGIVADVTLSLVAELRKAMVVIRRTILESVPLTTKEKVLRSMWSKFLNVDEEKLSMDDNFFRLGGDSIVAMRMVSALRREGYRLSVADIFQNMQLQSMANALFEVTVESTQRVEYSPFSLLKSANIDSLLHEQVRPQLANSSWTVCDILPATDPQQRDVRATVSRPRSSVQYNMLYFDDKVIIPRLVESFQHLVLQHPILRTVFVELDSQIHQVVLENIDCSVTEHRVEGPFDDYCKRLALEDIEIDSNFALGQLFIHLFVIQGAETQALMIRISHAQYDGFSLPELLRQLELRYRGLETPSSASFATFMQHMQLNRTDNISFWRQALQDSTPTQLIAPASPSSTTSFMTKAIDVTGSSPDTTLAMLLTAGWATIMAQYLNVTDVTFGGIVSGRDSDVPGVDNIMGPCYQYMPIRVKFEPKWTARQLLDDVRDKYLRGSPRATLGFQDILTECTDWPTNTPFYGSFTNHLNREYFEKMPFADTHCRVDYLIPHPEPSTPPRVVSFVEHDKTCIGIEADEERREFWEARLEELARVIEGFVSNPRALLWAPDFDHLEDHSSDYSGKSSLS